MSELYLYYRLHKLYLYRENYSSNSLNGYNYLRLCNPTITPLINPTTPKNAQEIITQNIILPFSVINTILLCFCITDINYLVFVSLVTQRYKY